MSKGISLDGEKLKQLRVAKGWRVSDLADKAECSEKTIQNAEDGKPIYVSKIKDMADALKVTPEQLMPGAEEKSLKFKIIIECDLNALEASPIMRLLVQYVEKLTGAEGIKIVDVTDGSLIVTLEMDRESALKVIAAFPRFKTMAVELIAEDLETWEGRGRGKAREMVRMLRELKPLVEGIKELRIESE